MEKKLNLRRTVRSKKLTRKAPGKKVKSKKKFQKGTFHADISIPNPPSNLLTALNFILYCSLLFYKTIDITTLYVIHFDYEDLDV